MDADGNYFLSQSQVAEAVEVHKFLVTRFLREQRENEGYTGHTNERVNDLKALPVNGYRGHKINFGSTTGNRGGNGKINIIPIQFAALFWMAQAHKGNVKAQACVYKKH